MRQKIEHAKHQAEEANRRAGESADARIKAEWLMVARIWRELMTEYETLEGISPRPGNIY